MTSGELARTVQIEQGDLWNELRVEGTWFHVMRSFSHNREIAKIGTMALAVYIVIKGHTEFQTGNAFPSISRIADQIGVSDDTVRLAQKVLVEHGWLKVSKSGRNNTYSVVEKVSLKSKDGTSLGTANRKYISAEFKDFIDQLERLAKTGNLPTDRNIVVNLTINVNNITQGDNGVVMQGDSHVQNVTVGTDEELRAALRKL